MREGNSDGNRRVDTHASRNLQYVKHKQAERVTDNVHVRELCKLYLRTRLRPSRRLLRQTKVVHHTIEKEVKKKRNPATMVLAIILSMTIGLVAGTEGFVDLSTLGASLAPTSVLKGGYDAGYEDGLKEGKELAAESNYDSGYDDGYGDALADLVSTTTVTRKPTASDNTGSYVYITATGEKYHKRGCQYLRDSCYEITYVEAVVDGYEPCSRCY